MPCKTSPKFLINILKRGVNLWDELAVLHWIHLTFLSSLLFGFPLAAIYTCGYKL